MMTPFWIYPYGGYFFRIKRQCKIKHLRGLIELNSARKSINKRFLKVLTFA